MISLRQLWNCRSHSQSLNVYPLVFLKPHLSFSLLIENGHISWALQHLSTSLRWPRSLNLVAFLSSLHHLVPRKDILELIIRVSAPQPAFTCSKLATERLEQGLKHVQSKDSRTTSLKSFRCLYCLLWTYFTPCSSVSAVKFEQVNVGWDYRKYLTL